MVSSTSGTHHGGGGSSPLKPGHRGTPTGSSSARSGWTTRCSTGAAEPSTFPVGRAGHAPDERLRLTTLRADSAAGVRLALEHLHQQGHRRIGFLTGPVDTIPGLGTCPGPSTRIVDDLGPDSPLRRCAWVADDASGHRRARRAAHVAPPGVRPGTRCSPGTTCWAWLALRLARREWLVRVPRRHRGGRHGRHPDRHRAT